MSRCAACHGVDLRGGAAPALIGPALRAALPKSVTTAEALDRWTRLNMPADDPGSLTAQQSQAVTGYILRANGLSASEAVSPQEAAKLLLK